MNLQEMNLQEGLVPLPNNINTLFVFLILLYYKCTDPVKEMRYLIELSKRLTNPLVF